MRTEQEADRLCGNGSVCRRRRRPRDRHKTGKAVSSPKRLELLDILCQGERTVEALAKETGLTVANASQHLQVLRATRLVEAEKMGLYVTYRLADQMVCEFFLSMRVLAENRLAEVEQIKRQFLEGREGMSRDGGHILNCELRSPLECRYLASA